MWDTLDSGPHHITSVCYFLIEKLPGLPYCINSGCFNTPRPESCPSHRSRAEVLPALWVSALGSWCYFRHSSLQSRGHVEHWATWVEVQVKPVFILLQISVPFGLPFCCFSNPSWSSALLSGEGMLCMQAPLSIALISQFGWLCVQDGCALPKI